VEPPDAEGEGVSKPPQPTTLPTTVPASVPARQLVLHVHLSSEAITGTGTPSIDPATGALGIHLARVSTATGAHRATVTAAQVATWAGNPDTQVIVKPVVDLTETVSVDAYEIPDRIAYRVTEQRQTCTFPFCTRSAMRADLDHIDEYVPRSQGGPPRQTSTETLAPLCRTHHRAKTHPSPSHQPGRSEKRWRYRRIRPGTYVWTSPHGRHFLVDPDGTEHLT
ncbi:HNH endonuclease, partial [Nocardioides acrostichi]|uniref:HNH endonuclease n=1 Tax=Nocardioides acrostichi TaxID=2784339 RepID=UPI001A9C78E9